MQKSIAVVPLKEGKIPVIRRNDTFQAVINKLVRKRKDSGLLTFDSPTEPEAGDIFIAAWNTKKIYDDVLPEYGVSIFKVVEQKLETVYQAFVPYHKDCVRLEKLYPHEAVKYMPELKQLLAGIRAELTWFATNEPEIVITDPEAELF